MLGRIFPSLVYVYASCLGCHSSTVEYMGGIPGWKVGKKIPSPQDKGYISHWTQSRQNESLCVGSLIAARGGELP